mmetsp:Transcript_2096/g.4860  ORF Transcript_2096/g.4860 Transcript_2096/m.4860 type:complete len:275 (+) Transcript_2096:358-1182(+)
MHRAAPVLPWWQRRDREHRAAVHHRLHHRVLHQGGGQGLSAGRHQLPEGRLERAGLHGGGGEPAEQHPGHGVQRLGAARHSRPAPAAHTLHPARDARANWDHDQVGAHDRQRAALLRLLLYHLRHLRPAGVHGRTTQPLLHCGAGQHVRRARRGGGGGVLPRGGALLLPRARRELRVQPDRRGATRDGCGTDVHQHLPELAGAHVRCGPDVPQGQQPQPRHHALRQHLVRLAHHLPVHHPGGLDAHHVHVHGRRDRLVGGVLHTGGVHGWFFSA